MSSGKEEEAKSMEAVSKVNKSNALDVTVLDVAAKARFRCHMIAVLLIRMPSATAAISTVSFCKKEIIKINHCRHCMLVYGRCVVVVIRCMVVASAPYLLTCHRMSTIYTINQAPRRQQSGDTNTIPPINPY